MPRPLRRHCQIRHEWVAGFTLTEVLVMAFVLMVGTAAVATLTGIIGRNQIELNTANRTADAISADIAEVRRMNDRFTCAGLTTSSGGNCVISTSDPDQDGYYPSNVDGQANFRNRCTYQGGAELVTPLAALIPANSSASAALTAAGVTRTIDTANQGNAHLYSVTYSAGGNTIATLTLVPTTAAWCP